MRSYLPRDAAFELIDVGAGAGLLATFMERDRPLGAYRFVEPITSLRQFLRDRHGERSDAGSDPDFLSAHFVALLDVLEHQRDDRAFLADLVGKMSPGATLLLTVPARPDLWSQWDVALGHHRRYERATLLACVAGLPLAVHETSYLFPEMLPLGLARARRRSVGPAPGSHPGGTTPDPGDDDAEFPHLPGPVNDLLTFAGSASIALRRRWPTGTSLFLAATVRRHDGANPSR